MKNEPIKYNHAKPLDRLEWFVIILYSLLAWYFFSVGSPVYILLLVLAVKSVYELTRGYWLRSKTSHALILTNDYIHAPSGLVSKYTYPIAWEDIQAIAGTIEKKSKLPSEYSLFLLKNRTKILGQITKSDAKQVRKLSKKYLVSGLFDVDNFDSEDAIKLNDEYFQNSIVFDFSFIAAERAELIQKLEVYSDGKMFGNF